MIKNANSTVIGSFIIGAVILIVVVFLVFGSRKLFVTTNQFVIYFRSSPQGLSIGTPADCLKTFVNILKFLFLKYQKEEYNAVYTR